MNLRSKYFLFSIGLLIFYITFVFSIITISIEYLGYFGVDTLLWCIVPLFILSYGYMHLKRKFLGGEKEVEQDKVIKIKGGNYVSKTYFIKRDPETSDSL